MNYQSNQSLFLPIAETQLRIENVSYGLFITVHYLYVYFRFPSHHFFCNYIFHISHPRFNVEQFTVSLIHSLCCVHSYDRLSLFHKPRFLILPPPPTTRDTSMMIKLLYTNVEHYRSSSTYVILPFTLSTFIFIRVIKTPTDHLFQATEYTFPTFTIESLSELQAIFIQWIILSSYCNNIWLKTIAFMTDLS